jgi:recombinational DNA repair protein (RecF pathway)
MIDMHQIHTTPGFIIQARPYGEAGKLLSIFTRDFGLITAAAQGIRLEKSKLRYYTQEHALGLFSLVKGREMWRLTSAGSLASFMFHSGGALLVPDISPRKDFIARVALLLRRLLQGEEGRPEVFDAVQSCFQFMNVCQSLTDDRLATLESLLVARILHWLGYIGDDNDLNDHMRSFGINTGLLDVLDVKRAILNKHINKALKESMM